MGTMSRTKGQTGEREIATLVADLTGWTVKRRVRQHQGDTDLEGVPGWAVECKRHARATRSDMAGWWAQAVQQAACAGATPVLFYRVDRDQWRAVWPVALHLVGADCFAWNTYEMTVEGSVEAWAAVAREAAAAGHLAQVNGPSIRAGIGGRMATPASRETFGGAA